jgi:hypothetical protein
MFSHQQRQNASLEQTDSSQKRASTTQPISKAGLQAGLPLYLENRPVLRPGQEAGRLAELALAGQGRPLEPALRLEKYEQPLPKIAPDIKQRAFVL